MAKIDEKLEKVYSFLEEYRNKYGYSPSIREICTALNIKSTATAHFYINRLASQGRIYKANQKNRAVSFANDKSVDNFSVPVIGTVTAGQPIFAYENLEGYVSLPDDFSPLDDLFILRVKGTSMIDAGIFDGDKIIVKKQSKAENGDIVVALIDDEATVKRFFIRQGKIVLHPENTTMKDIYPEKITILGTVVGLYRKY